MIGCQSAFEVWPLPPPPPPPPPPSPQRQAVESQTERKVVAPLSAVCRVACSRASAFSQVKMLVFVLGHWV